MNDGAAGLFEQINSYQSLLDLIDAGESEGLHLECKAPSEPRLTKEQKGSLATAISGFSNTAGGIFIFGLSTTKHQHTGLDVITQIEPIGQVAKLDQQLRAAIPTLTTPRVLGCKTRIIREHPRDTRGVVLLYVPQTTGDPILSTVDNIFYIRTGDDFRAPPFEIIKRLFFATESPDVKINFNQQLVKKQPDGMWNIPISLSNESTAIAEHVKVSIAVHNPEATESIQVTQFRDVSELNPGSRIFMTDIAGVLHRGLGLVAGNLVVKMQVGTRVRRSLKLEISVYANRMRARKLTCNLALASNGLKIKHLEYSYVY